MGLSMSGDRATHIERQRQREGPVDQEVWLEIEAEAAAGALVFLHFLDFSESTGNRSAGI